MAPALIQVPETSTLAEVTRHSHLPQTINGALLAYPHFVLPFLEYVKDKFEQPLKPHFPSSYLWHLINTASFYEGRSYPGLALPADGWSERRLLQSVPELNMDGSLTWQPQSRVSDEAKVSSPVSSEHSVLKKKEVGPLIMGSQTAMIGRHSPNDLPKYSAKSNKISQTSLTSSGSRTVHGQSEMISALMGQDINNVEYIIETLQKLASNPDLLTEVPSQPTPASTGTSNTINRTESTVSSKSVESKPPVNVLNCLLNQQKQLEHRQTHLLRRLRKISARGAGITISKKINSLIQYSRTVISEEKQKYIDLDKDESSEDRDLHTPLRLDDLQKDAMKSMSTSDLVNLVRRVETSQIITRNNTAILKKVLKPPSFVCHKLPKSVCRELSATTCEMKGAMYSQIYHHDSDATDSSSGGESCDENDGYPKHPVDPVALPILNRALHKYSRLRGWVTSRWLWLQAQIAELDYQITQQKKKNAGLQISKSAVQVQLDDPTVNNGKNRQSSRDPAFFTMADPALTCATIPPLSRHTINSYHSNPSAKIEDRDFSSMGVISDSIPYGCSRTLGTKKVRRRKYVKLSSPFVNKRTTTSSSSRGSERSIPRSDPAFKDNSGLSVISKRYRTKYGRKMHCRCLKSTSCILCVDFNSESKCGDKKLVGGAFDVKSAMRSSANLSTSHRLAQIDPSFHPVLSRPSDMNQSLHLENRLKYYKPSMPLSFKSLKPTDDCSIESSALQSVSLQMRDSEDNLSSAELKSEPVDRLDPVVYDHDLPLLRRRRKNRDRSLSMNSRHSTPVKDEISQELVSAFTGSVGGSNSNTSSPCPSPANFTSKVTNNMMENRAFKKTTSALAQRDHRPIASHSTMHPQKKTTSMANNSDSYDIDNIVIPYSMAASSKVEVLQYKEIPTPKWRIVDRTMPHTLGGLNDLSEEDEDMSETCIVARHQRSFEEERQKFLKYAHGHGASRQSRARRIDSSGTNTPDQPMSPRPLYEHSAEQTPVPSPLSPTIEGDRMAIDSQSGHSLQASTVLSLSLASIQVDTGQSTLNSPDAIDFAKPKLETVAPDEHMDDGGKISDAASSASPKHDMHSCLITKENGMDWAEEDQMSSTEMEERSGRISPFVPRAFPLEEIVYREMCKKNPKVKPKIGSAGQFLLNSKPHLSNSLEKYVIRDSVPALDLNSIEPADISCELVPVSTESVRIGQHNYTIGCNKFLKQSFDSIEHSADMLEIGSENKSDISSMIIPLMPVSAIKSGHETSLGSDSVSMQDDELSGRSTPMSEVTASANSADEVDWSDEGKPDQRHPPDFTIRALKDQEGSMLLQVTTRSKTTHTA